MEFDKKYNNKLEGILDQFKQFKKEKKYLDHYLTNIISIVIGYEKGFVDYETISHGNRLMCHGTNRLVAALFGEL